MIHLAILLKMLYEKILLTKRGFVMKKIVRLFSIILVITIGLFQFNYFSFSANAESVRNKKVVSIVYDDSGSMHMEGALKWSYANYAMQSFAGMLNKEDELLINYMSDVEKGKNATAIDTTDRKNSVSKIRSHSATSGTPFAAIQKAFDALQSYDEKNSNTQYWLVVMTDGQFENGDITDVEEKLCEIADAKMPNGTSPKIIYLSMCDTSNSFTPKDGLRSNISVKKANEAKDITGAISEISDEISGRYSVPEADIKFIDDTTVEVVSKLPLVNIGVLSQYSQAEVKEVKGSKGDKLTVESNVNIKYPEVKGRETDKSLIGNVALINIKDANIPADTYTIKFSEPISKDNINIMFEPAIELRLTLYSNGKEVTDLTKIRVETVLEAKATLYEMGTNKEIDLNLLPDGISHSINQKEDNKEISSTDTLKLSGIKLNPVETTINAEFTLPGYFTLYDSCKFTPVEYSITGIKSEISYDGSERREYKDKKTGKKVLDGENVVYISDLKTNKTGVKFILEVNGKVINKEMAETMLPEFKEALKADIEPYTIEIQDDGSYLVYPSKKGWWYPSIIYWLKYHGENKISANIDGIETESALIIKLGDLMCLLDIWPWLLITYFIIWLFFKQRFKKGRIVGYKGRIDQQGDMQYERQFSINERIGWGTDKFYKWLWIGPAQKDIGGYTFQGGSNFFIREDRVHIVGVKGKLSDNSKRPRTKLEVNKTRIRSEKIIGDGFTYIHFYKKKR